jgi:hypothetical protein
MEKEKNKASTPIFVLALVAYFWAPFGLNLYLSCAPRIMWMILLGATWLLFLAIQRVVGIPLLTDERGRWSLLQLPTMPENLVTLIGISHATYLAGKVPKHT